MYGLVYGSILIFSLHTKTITKWFVGFHDTISWVDALVDDLPMVIMCEPLI
jgi:hypothetical protein